MLLEKTKILPLFHSEEQLVKTVCNSNKLFKNITVRIFCLKNDRKN
jgi:hypothetical protein